MFKGNLLDNVQKNVFSMIEGTSKTLKQMQSSPAGTKERSARERNNIWKKLNNLPEEVKGDIMTEMATFSGHKGESFDNCDWCKFVKEQTGV